MDTILLEIIAVVCFGVFAQWLAWRFHLPSILLLIVAGFVVGPLTQLLQPDQLLGDLLFPLISLSVAFILFEGGLNLRLVELNGTGKVVVSLVSLGALVTWGMTTVLAYVILQCSLAYAVLLGAILMVTGPTVIIPLIRHIRPKKQMDSILRWEGILIDPIGAIIAVLVFETIIFSGSHETTSLVVIGLFKSVVVGGALGVLAATVIIVLFKYYFVPDFLKNSITIAFVLMAFGGSNFAQEESGLLAVTIMGAVLANQRLVVVKHIIEFKENLRVLLITTLFMVLVARISVDSIMAYLNWRSLCFLIALLVIVRPMAVVLSTLKSKLPWREKAFLAWMAPRGIVAAAVSSIFSFYLVQKGHHEFESLVPITFLMVFGTVVVYSLTAPIVARRLGISARDSQGFLIVGAHSWAIQIAKAIQEQGFQVILVDTERRNTYKANMEGIPACHASVLSEYFWDEIDLHGIGRLLAITSNEEVNSLAALHFAEVFDYSEVYQLRSGITGNEHRKLPIDHLRGRTLFREGTNYDYLEECFAKGAEIKTTLLTEEFDFIAYQEMYQDAIVMFLIDENKQIKIFTTEHAIMPKPGDTIVSIVK